jgi:hypothetical protein
MCDSWNMKLVSGWAPTLWAPVMQHYGDWKVAEVESRSQHGSGQAKLCLDFETLALRVEPPVVSVEAREDATVVTVDSANMPGILVEVSPRVHKATFRLRLRRAGGHPRLAILPGKRRYPRDGAFTGRSLRLPVSARLRLHIHG